MHASLSDRNVSQMKLINQNQSKSIMKKEATILFLFFFRWNHSHSERFRVDPGILHSVNRRTCFSYLWFISDCCGFIFNYVFRSLSLSPSIYPSLIWGSNFWYFDVCILIGMNESTIIIPWQLNRKIYVRILAIVAGGATTSCNVLITE